MRERQQEQVHLQTETDSSNTLLNRVAKLFLSNEKKIFGSFFHNPSSTEETNLQLSQDKHAVDSSFAEELTPAQEHTVDPVIAKELSPAQQFQEKVDAFRTRALGALTNDEAAGVNEILSKLSPSGESEGENNKSAIELLNQVVAWLDGFEKEIATSENPDAAITGLHNLFGSLLLSKEHTITTEFVSKNHRTRPSAAVAAHVAGLLNSLKTDFSDFNYRDLFSFRTMNKGKYLKISVPSDRVGELRELHNLLRYAIEMRANSPELKALLYIQEALNEIHLHGVQPNVNSKELIRLLSFIHTQDEDEVGVDLSEPRVKELMDEYVQSLELMLRTDLVNTPNLRLITNAISVVEAAGKATSPTLEQQLIRYVWDVCDPDQKFFTDEWTFGYTEQNITDQLRQLAFFTSVCEALVTSWHSVSNSIPQRRIQDAQEELVSIY